MSLIKVHDVSLGYEGKTVAEGISFSVNLGDYLCVVGENGSGKSTLLKALLHIKAPLSGQIKVGDGFSRKSIGYLPQQTPAQKDFPASVYEIVLSGCSGRLGLRPFYNNEEKQRAKNNMTRLGILDLAKHCFRDLSGGQQQRVLLARALCASNGLLLLDEPVAGLDPVVTSELYNIIDELNKKDGVTIIMVSHDSEAVARATHVLHIHTHSHFFGTVEEYRRTALFRTFPERKEWNHHD